MPLYVCMLVGVTVIGLFEVEDWLVGLGGFILAEYPSFRCGTEAGDVLGGNNVLAVGEARVDGTHGEGCHQVGGEAEPNNSRTAECGGSDFMFNNPSCSRQENTIGGENSEDGEELFIRDNGAVEITADNSCCYKGSDEQEYGYR